MKIRRLTGGVAATAALALVLTACASDGGDGDTTSSDTGSASASESESAEVVEPENSGKADLGDITTKDDTISYSLGAEEWLGYNGNTPATYSTYTSVVNDRIQSSFTYFGTDGAIYVNEELGNVELTSDDPMIVTYTINEDAVWSDGTPITYEDALYSWATQAIEDGVDDEGNPAGLFNYVGGLDLGSRTPDGPQGEPGGKTFTLEYADPFPDYMLSALLQFPAHIAAEQAGMSLEELTAAIQDKDVEALRPVAEFYNADPPSPGDLPDPEIALSSGPYQVTSWEAGQSVTLEPNPNWWGTPPATKTLIYRFAAPETQVQALQNGDLNIIEPQATVDTLSQIEAIGDTVNLISGSSLTWEHLDFNFRSPNVSDLLVRQAFAMCVPRQLIVDNLIKPIDPEAVVMNAREVFPFQDTYEEVVAASYDGSYDEVDIEGAKAKLAEAGVTTPVQLRIGYSGPNQRRTEEVALIKDSCDQAGFAVEDIGSGEFFPTVLPAGDYEVALFAWAGSGQIASGQNIYASDGGQNFGKYVNEDVDAAWDTLSTTLDTDVQLEEVKTIEKLLWDDLFGIPIFAHPGVVAYDSSILNVRDTATQSTVAWNAEQWVRAE